MGLWDHQERGLSETVAAIEAGERRIAFTSPTGGGKTLCMCELIERLDLPTVLYTNRRMLLEQTATRLEGHGIRFGILASGHMPSPHERVQLAMIQTVDSRVYKREKTTLHWAKLVLIDEAHVNAAGTAQRIIDEHLADGAALVGFTATPLGIGHIYDRLIVAGTPSELRRCGALVASRVFAPDEPDAKSLKQSVKTGEFTEGSVRKAIMTKQIFGRVYDHWRIYNPDALPAILFAPGVRESIWFCEEFSKKGVRCAHIDGEQCWIDGEFLPADQETRDHIADISRTGEIHVVCNRFVLREGIDWPWLFHGILATCFGSLTSYLQSVGRLLRAHPGMDSVCIQDHGGNWHRHGSPNADREWNLSDTAYRQSQIHQDRMRAKKEPEPIVCPQCHQVRLSGPVCPGCGHQHTTRARMVMQLNGTLKERTGDIYSERRRAAPSPTLAKDWEKMYWRSRKAGRTFVAAEALFAMEHNWQYPPRTLPLMPTSELDWYEHVADVPIEELIPKG